MQASTKACSLAHLLLEPSHSKLLYAHTLRACLTSFNHGHRLWVLRSGVSPSPRGRNEKGVDLVWDQENTSTLSFELFLSSSLPICFFISIDPSFLLLRSSPSLSRTHHTAKLLIKSSAELMCALTFKECACLRYPHAVTSIMWSEGVLFPKKHHILRVWRAFHRGREGRLPEIEVETFRLNSLFFISCLAPRHFFGFVSPILSSISVFSIRVLPFGLNRRAGRSCFENFTQLLRDTFRYDSILQSLLCR